LDRFLARVAFLSLDKVYICIFFFLTISVKIFPALLIDENFFFFRFFLMDNCLA